MADGMKHDVDPITHFSHGAADGPSSSASAARTAVNEHPRQSESFQPIFVVGCPRSGTTLLSVILDRHSEVAVPPETHFAEAVIPAASGENALLADGADASLGAVKTLIRETPLNDLGLDPRAVWARLRERPVTPARLLRSVLQEYASLRKKPKVAEKTPGHELHLDQILAWCPRARFVWIVRDGRAVVESQRRMHWIAQPVWQLSLHWRRSAIQTLRFEAKHPGRIYRIRYEEMVRDPRRALEPMHKFLGIDLEAQQLRPCHSSRVIPVHENGWKLRATQAIDARRLEAWRDGTSRTQLLVMNCVMGRYLRHFDYPDATMREFGFLGVALGATMDLALRVLFLPPVYRAVRGGYRATKRLAEAAQRFVKHPVQYAALLAALGHGG
ncbi:MAG: sulfotransferase [Hyphomonadaceae bacterium]